MKASRLFMCLPVYSDAQARLFVSVKDGLQKLNPILSDLRVFTVAHRGRVRQLSGPTKIETNSLFIDNRLEVSQGSVPKTDELELRDNLVDLCERFFDEKIKFLLSVERDVSSVTGRTESINDRNPGDVFIDLLRRSDIHFDENGDYKLTLVAGKKAFKELSEHPITESQRLEKQKIIDEKRADKDDAVGNRRLKR